MIELNKKNISLGVGLLFLLIFVLKDPVYECSKDQEAVVATSLKSCLEEETKQKELEINKSIKEKELQLEALKERNRHCESIQAQGKMCEKELATRSMELIKNKDSCATQARSAVCERKNFAWKLLMW